MSVFASGGLDIARLLPLRTRRHFERDLLTFLERLEALHLDRGEVREEVFTTAIRGNEAEALRVVEPLHSSCCHVLSIPQVRDVSGTLPGRCFDLKESTAGKNGLSSDSLAVVPERCFTAWNKTRRGLYRIPTPKSDTCTTARNRVL